MMDLIDRKQAIGKIKDWMKFLGYSHSERNVMECTIQMLEELPPAESRENHAEITRSSRDLIDRQDVINAICTWDKFGVDERGRVVRWYEGLEPYVHLRDVVFAIEKLPSAEPKQKTGKWIHREDMDFIDQNKVKHIHLMCENCGLIHDFFDGHTGQYKFCPNCGARMECDTDG